MIRLRAWCLLAAVWIPLLAGADAITDSARVPADVFAGQPRGPYQTGTYEELWIDNKRAETRTSDPDDPRRLMVQLWYPATFKGDPQRARYALHRELYPDNEETQWLNDTAAVRTNSVLNAPLAPQPQRFPVLIYNPGASHPPFSATFQTEFLASHGYVVVAIGHTGLTGIERFPDGSRYRPDSDDPDLSEQESAGLRDVERFRHSVERYAKRLIPVHVQDIGFVLDRLQIMAQERGNRFYQRLDLDRMGSLGWSLGGALSLQASRDEPRVKAAVNLDGWLYTDVQDTGTHRPIMIVHGGDPFADSEKDSAAVREQRLFAETLPWQLFARSQADWYDATLARAEHEHFSDRPLFEPIDPQLIHPRLAHDIVNRLTLEFFDKYLRQRPATPLLSGEQEYPELQVRKRPDRERQQ